MRIQFITQKIKEMQKKRTFMTAPEMIAQEESDDGEVEIQEPLYNFEQKDLMDEYKDMLQDVLDTQKMVRGNTDDLEEIRKMIHQTKNNINNHINTVDQLKTRLTTINEKSKDTLVNAQKDKVDPDWYTKKTLTKGLRNAQSVKSLGNGKPPKIDKSAKKVSMKKEDEKYEEEMNNMIFSASNNMDKIREAKLQDKPNYESETKIEIMNTLLHINGSMKEFAEDIEERMYKAYKSKAGKKYGLSEADIELKKAQHQSLGFSSIKQSTKEINRQAKQYLSQINNGNVNLKFLRKNIA